MSKVFDSRSVAQQMKRGGRPLHLVKELHANLLRAKGQEPEGNVEVTPERFFMTVKLITAVETFASAIAAERCCGSMERAYRHIHYHSLRGGDGGLFPGEKGAITAVVNLAWSRFEIDRLGNVVGPIDETPEVFEGLTSVQIFAAAAATLLDEEYRTI